MELTVAVLGAGRMGSFVGEQLPEEVNKIIVDSDEPKAKELAKKVGGTYTLTAQGAATADVVAIVLPAPVVNDVAKALAGIVKDGAIILNMATNAEIGEEIKGLRPSVHFVDAKIIGHAKAMSQGATSCVVVSTEDEKALGIISYCLPGYTRVVSGDVRLVPKLNTIGSTEGIRAAVMVRKQLKQYNVPKEWEDVVISTVCAGTMRAYVDNDLGEFGLELAKKMEAEA